jgi:threonine dehydrogenase-like Zn-dependent dehydrogenase
VRALTVVPGQAGSASVVDMPEPTEAEGALLVHGLAMGVCGTDGEITRGEYGEAPEGEERLILGHESLGRVLEAAGDFAAGDLVVGIVRRPDPEPCVCCARGEWDMCRNGRYTERGIKGRHGYGSQRWRVEPDFAVKLDPALESVGVLLEPATILAKAWDHIDRILARACTGARVAVVTGAGPVGLLGALLSVQRGYETHVLDVVEDGPKPELVARLGAEYHPTPLSRLGFEADVLIEATGAPEVILGAIEHNGPNGVVCLTGVSSGGRAFGVDLGAVNRAIVLENDVIFGSVNANRRHYELAADALAGADRDWLQALITRRVGLEDFAAALERRDGDVKTVIELNA